MKRALERIPVWMKVLFWAVLCAYLALPIFSRKKDDARIAGIDFEMRVNEARCVLDGVDPFLVWNGTCPREGYTPWSFARIFDLHKTHLVHAYPPWSYAFISPFACLPRAQGRLVYDVLQWSCVLLLLCWAFARGAAVPGYSSRAVPGFVALSAALMVAPAIARCLVVCNYGILIAASAAAALYCHRKGMEAVAGVFWAFTLVKPQIGAMLFVPLLVRCRWRTLAVSATVVAAGTLFSSALCGRAPWDMVLSVFEYTKGQFHGTVMVPGKFAEIMSPYVSQPALSAIGALFCIAICAFCSFRLRNVVRDSLWAVPALICSVMWSASRDHDRCIWVLPLALLASLVLRREGARSTVALILLLPLMNRDLDDVLAFPLSLNLVQLTALAVMTVLAFIWERDWQR